MFRSLTPVVIAALTLGGVANATPWHGLIQVTAAYHENFLEAAEGRPRENILAETFGGRLIIPLDWPVDLWVEGEYTNYQTFDPSSRFGLSVRYDLEPHTYEFDLTYHLDRPRFDIGDEFDRADGYELHNQYLYKIFHPVQLGVTVDLLQESYAVSGSKDNTDLDLGTSMRLRGFGRGFSPEFGISWGRRDVDDDNDDYDERTLYLKVRSAPSDLVYLSGRFRHRARDYSIADAAASNFLREDTRNDVTLSIDLKPEGRLSWNVYLSYEDATSTKASRTFTTWMAGLTMRFRVF